MQPLRNKVRECERDIDRLSAMIDKTEQKLADPTLYADAPQKVEGYSVLLADLRKQIAAAEAAWLSAEAKLEAAGNP